LTQPIEETYQQGFITGYPDGYFHPNQPVSKIEAIVALSKGLNLTTGTSTLSIPTAMQRVVPQKTAQKPIKARIFMSFVFTTLMQPLLISKVPALVVNAVSLNRPASFIITNTYADTNNITQYAVGDVAAATKANIVVSYPNPKVINPNKLATRGEITALVYQTLVSQGKIELIAINLPANRYVIWTPVHQKTLNKYDFIQHFC
jgi:hypothetical protein